MHTPYYRLLCSKDEVAGKQDSRGYWVISTRSLLSKGEKLLFQAHRVIWELVYGAIEEGYVIDHIDGNPSNNSLSNLRLVTYSGNSRNRASIDGRNGVSFCRKFWPNSDNFTDYWLARITGDNNKRIQKNFQPRNMVINKHMTWQWSGTIVKRLYSRVTQNDI